MDTATQQVEQSHCAPPVEDDIYHPPRPSAESRFYTVTVGKKPGVYQGIDDWHSQVDGVSGSAVRSFDTIEAAQQAYEDAIDVGLVYKVELTGDRRVLTEEDIQTIPGMQAPDANLLALKWYSVYVGTHPGLYPGSQNISPLISNVKGGRSARWQSYEHAYDSFISELQAGRIVQDNTDTTRTQLV